MSFNKLDFHPVISQVKALQIPQQCLELFSQHICESQIGWFVIQIYCDHCCMETRQDLCQTWHLDSMSKPSETKRNTHRDFNGKILVWSARGNRGSKMRRLKEPYGIKAERREEKVREKKKETDGGRERWEEWSLIAGSHGPEKELLVLTWLDVCMCGHLCVCVIRVPQSAKTKGV